MKLDKAALDAHPLPPIVDGDKETKGQILVLAGSRDVPGAALLAAEAAMRAGAGKLRIATVESAAMAVAVAMPEAMVIGLSEADDGGFADSAVERLIREVSEVDAVVAGPGVKQNNACPSLARALLESEKLLALDVALIKALRQRERKRRMQPILLPDSDELATLLDCGIDAVDADPIGCGLHAAESHQCIVLVKGPTSHVATADGQVWTYDGGAPGLGVSGSGDVLAGIVGGLLARGADPLNALLWAVWLHGEAGALLANKIGPLGFLAREIAREIPALLPR